MTKTLSILLFVACLCSETVGAETFLLDSDPADFPGPTSLFPAAYAPLEGVPRDFAQPVKQSFSLTLWPKVVEMKALYMEKRAEGAAPEASSNPNDTNWGRYLGITATTSQFSGKLIGEGELAYSTLGFAGVTDQQRPMMARMTLRGNWDNVGYGVLHRSLGSGFISTAGAKIANDRDENELWGEYDFKIFRLRGTLGELREMNSDTNQPSLTRTAATSLNFARSGWSALLSSSISTSALGNIHLQESHALTNGVALAYRPASFFSIEPNLSFKQEWDQTTGAKTDTPSAGFLLSCTPWSNLQLTGRASYSRGISEDSVRDASTLNTLASLNWKIGKSLGTDQYLSLQFEYRNQRANPTVSNSSPNITGMVQLKLLDF
jgi:hypothetical protein